MIRNLVLATITAGALCGQDSAVDIMRRSIELEARNRHLAKDYTYQFTESTTQADDTKTKTYEVLVVYGRPFTRLIAKNGQPLPESERQKQETRLQKEMEKRKRESENPNSGERREFEKQQAEMRRFLDEVPRAFNFRIAGEENVSGKPAWMIQAEPKPGYKPSLSRAGMLSKIHGRIWIDKTEYQWVKLDAETTDTISFGLFLARLGRGSSFRFEQRRVNDEVWLPSHAEIAIDGRLALLKRVRAGIDIRYSNYRKFQTDSRIVSTTPTP